MNRLLSRREFLKVGCTLSLGLGLGPLPLTGCAQAMSNKKGYVSPVEARYYFQMDEFITQCLLCPRNCLINKGKRGFCRVRENVNGQLQTLAYGNPCAVHIDPIEKKPFFHFLPTSRVFSLATSGCTFRCQFCQNWQISQAPPEETVNFAITPKMIVEAAKKNSCQVIAYTYTEPTVFFEYMLDTARLAKKNGIRNSYHTNGFINQPPLKELCQYLDAACIDLKGFTNTYYNSISQGWLEPVLNTLKTIKDEGVHFEIVNLVIPTKNDNTELFKEMVLWIKKELGDNHPLHISRFYPHYKLEHLPPTPIANLEALRNTARSAGLKYVYLGNVPGHPAENTYCPKCEKLIIRRFGFQVLENNLAKGKCKFCQQPINGFWER